MMGAFTRIGLGAINDDPVALAHRAIRDARAAITALEDRGDDVELRRAAELGWLAASSAADVAANKLGLDVPAGFQARTHALRALEKALKLRTASLSAHLKVARDVLHGACFHGGDCGDPAAIPEIIEMHVLELAKVVAAAVVKRKR